LKKGDNEFSDGWSLVRVCKRCGEVDVITADVLGSCAGCGQSEMGAYSTDVILKGCMYVANEREHLPSLEARRPYHDG
jgi:hypothetical protein